MGGGGLFLGERGLNRFKRFKRRWSELWEGGVFPRRKGVNGLSGLNGFGVLTLRKGLNGLNSLGP